MKYLSKILCFTGIVGFVLVILERLGSSLQSFHLPDALSAMAIASVSVFLWALGRRLSSVLRFEIPVMGLMCFFLGLTGFVFVSVSFQNVWQLLGFIAPLTLLSVLFGVLFFKNAKTQSEKVMEITFAQAGLIYAGITGMILLVVCLGLMLHPSGTH